MKTVYQSPILATLGIAAFLAQPSLAQTKSEPMGTIHATIDDTAYSGNTLDVPTEGTSTATIQSFGPMTSISIQALDPEVESTLHNTLVLEVSVMGSDASASIIEATLSWWPEGMGEPFYHSEGNETELDVSLDAFSLEDGASSVSGVFSALLCRKENFFTEPDLNECLAVDGTFDTDLRRIE